MEKSVIKNVSTSAGCSGHSVDPFAAPFGKIKLISAFELILWFKKKPSGNSQNCTFYQFYISSPVAKVDILSAALWLFAV